MSEPRRIILQCIGILGGSVFALVFAFTFITPDWIEEYGASFIEHEALKMVDQRIDAIRPPKGKGAVAQFAQGLYAKNEAEIENSKEALRNGAHQVFAAAIAEVRDLDCECRARWEGSIKSGYEYNIQLLQATNDKIVEFVQSTYMEVVAKLKRDIRIFSGVNTAMFIILLLVAWRKPQAMRHLFVPGMLLVLSTLVCSYFYIFEQNWLLTIIYSDYIGFYYLFYLGAVFGFLCDIVFNRARVTTAIANTILNAISSIQLSPC